VRNDNIDLLAPPLSKKSLKHKGHYSDSKLDQIHFEESESS